MCSMKTRERPNETRNDFSSVGDPRTCFACVEFLLKCDTGKDFSLIWKSNESHLYADFILVDIPHLCP